jgi:hypothetical protein
MCLGNEFSSFKILVSDTSVLIFWINIHSLIQIEKYYPKNIFIFFYIVFYIVFFYIVFLNSYSLVNLHEFKPQEMNYFLSLLSIY